MTDASPSPAETSHKPKIRLAGVRCCCAGASPPERTESREICRELARRLAQRLGMSQQPAHEVLAGAALLKPRDLVTHLPFIVQGRVDSGLHLHGDEGGCVIPVSWGAGEAVLLSPLSMGRSSFVDLVAGTNSSLRWSSVAEVQQALQQDKELLVLLVRFRPQRLREVQTRERAWVERGVHQRVCATLARLVQQYGHDEAGQARIVATHEEQIERNLLDPTL